MESDFAQQVVISDYARRLIKSKARQLCRRRGFDWSERADLEQELTLRLLVGAAGFDPDRASVNTFVACVVKTSVGMLVRERSRARRGTNCEMRSLSELQDGEHPSCGTLADNISPDDLARRTGAHSNSPVEAIDRSDAVASALRNLPRRIREVCRRLAENILAQSSWDFPPLAGIARAPILRHDGTICTQAGYDPVSRLYYCPDLGLTLSPIPEYPTTDEVQACLDILLNVISDFPFADDASRANALAVLFTLLMRPVVTGHVPLAIVDAPMQGTGKSLLVTSLATIAVGSIPSESIPAKDNDEEWRKKITSILLAASSFVHLDNIPDNTTINSPSLAAALTTGEWSDRLLGRNDTIRLPSRAVWAATGNNLRVTPQMR